MASEVAHGQWPLIGYVCTVHAGLQASRNFIIFAQQISHFAPGLFESFLNCFDWLDKIRPFDRAISFLGT